MVGLLLGLVLAQVALPDFDTQVAPLLEKRCLPCHSAAIPNASMDFRDRSSLVRTYAVVPGDPEASRVIRAIKHRGVAKMPPGAKLSGSDIATLEDWIAAGAPWGTALAPAPAAKEYPYEVWTFDRLRRIGNYPTSVEGHPRIVETPVGKAVEFNGTDDALFIERHPLAEAETFTWEMIFRPDEGGKPEQRVFHLQERDSSRADTLNRMLFEIRVQGSEWFLDSFVNSAGGPKALLNTGKLHPLGRWYHVAQVYDGREYRNYVDGVLENSADVRYAPQHDGHSSAGVRINRKDYFKGAIRQVKFTHGALKPEEFLEANWINHD
jgi:hypothetical protein